MKKIIELKLKFFAKLVLKKYKPEIVGITGSVGKTSTKEAIHAVLSSKFEVRRNIKNYNNEIGLPLSILGIDSPGKSIIGWFFLFLEATKLIIFKDKNYPEILVLEMGVDKPGDMAYLNKIVKLKIGVITLIGSSHLEFFNSPEDIVKEKSKILNGITSQGWAIFNNDDERQRELIKKSKMRSLTFGLKNKSDVMAVELVFSFEESRQIDNLAGISFKLTCRGSAIPVLLPDVIGYNSVYAALAAAAVGLAYGLNLVDISQSLRSFKSPRGRMNLLDGIKNTMIIDDSYNSSPQSSFVALDIVSKIKIGSEARKIAVLGDMMELGKYSEGEHRAVGNYLAKKRINKLIVVGERARDIARGAKNAGLKSDNIFNFDSSDQAKDFVQDRLRDGDLILIKGSQAARMEKIVKEIMKEPQRAKELLVRQDWFN